VSKGNRLKDKTIDETASAETKENGSRTSSFFTFDNNKPKTVFGIFIIIFSLYLFLAFISFLFTWKKDQDKLFVSTADFLFNINSNLENWSGKLGAYLSHLFIFNWFGIASFVFVLWFFLIGFKLVFKTSPISIKKSLKYGFITLIWSSFTFGFLFGNSYPIFGGGIGFYLSLWSSSLIGQIGTGLVIFFSILSFLVIKFDLNLEKLLVLFASNKPLEKEEISEEEIAQNNLKNRIIADKVNEDFVFEEEKTEMEEEIDFEVKQGIDNSELELEITQELPENSDLKLDIESPTEELEIVALANEEEIEEENFELEIEKSSIDEEVDATFDPLEMGDYDPTLDLSDFKFPSIDFLEKHGSNGVNINKEELEANKNNILNTLKNYNIGIASIKATIGPTVTLYEIVPEAGIRISKIKNLEDDIALSLAALGIRIIAPIPGKGTIGIEVPNQNPDIVSMRSVIASEKFKNTTYDLPVAIGKTISNEIFIADLAKMPHLLMAGATGQGKSVGLNAILVSLLYKKHPSQLKFVLVDPKKVELSVYNKIERHYLAKLPNTEEAIITDTKKVVNTLNSLCIEMDNRYDLLKTAGVRNLREYNAKFVARRLNPNKGHRFLPYIVLVVDEFADLMMTAGKEVETPIARLAQLARAIGIHLIIATQRPSVNIITGTIKANFPARIAFRVTSKIDSRTILDTGGADQLIGRGDMLYSTGNDLIRLQCAFVDTPEVETIIDFIGNQRGYPDAYELPEFIGDGDGEGSSDFDMADKDALFEEAARIIVQHQQGSASLLQRRLKLGYNRAGRIIDQLEAAGVIGPFEGSKARQVLISDEASLEQFLNSL
jgi:DNA segregation ATPase FtsK/SpoIIIE, S-DNA-T family